MLTPGDRAPLFAIKNADGGYWFSEEAGRPVVVSFVDELDEHLRQHGNLVWIVQ